MKGSKYLFDNLAKTGLFIAVMAGVALIACEREQRQTVNLNGMDPDADQIRDMGSGEYEKQMIRTLIDAGFDGNVGIIGHTHEEDVRKVLQRNRDGLNRILEPINR